MSDAGRTLVGSVLFLDIAEYSKFGVGEQVRLKQDFNAVLTGALEHVEASERVVVDTGDGAAIAFLGDPESAFYVALAIFDSAGELPVRMGINVGPISLMKDINGLANILGDGINVAQRIMGFAERGELLVSRSFYEVVSRLSADYATLFRYEGARNDKHGRAHEVYAVNQAVRVGRRVAEAAVRVRAERAASAQAIDRTPATIADAGKHFVVSARSRESLQEALDRLAAQGHKLVAAMTKTGNMWVASVDNPKLAVEARVDAFGLKRIVTAPTREAVELKVAELCELGAELVQDIELIDGQWSAVCESR